MEEPKERKISNKEGLMLSATLLMVVANEGTDEERKALSKAVGASVPIELVNKYWERVKKAVEFARMTEKMIEGFAKAKGTNEDRRPSPPTAEDSGKCNPSMTKSTSTP